MKPIKRNALLTVSLLAACALGLLGAAVRAQSSAAGYCQPQNSQFDPRDLGSLVVDPPPRGISERFRNLAGITTPVLQSGPQHASTAVVYIHGNPGSGRDFVDLMAASDRLGLRQVAFDLPGFGRAGRPWTFSYTADGYTHWLTQTLAQLGVRRAILVVHDIGGPLGMQWAAAHPRQFIATAIIDSGVLVGYQDHYLARIWKTPVLGETFMAGVNRQVFETGLQNGQQKPLPHAFLERMYAEFDRVTRCAILSTYRSVPDVDALARRQQSAIAPLKRPALVIWGAHDPYLPTQLAYAQRDTFPSAQIHILSDAAHWPFVDEPATVTQLVKSFLTHFRPPQRHPPHSRRPGHGRSHRMLGIT